MRVYVIGGLLAAVALGGAVYVLTSSDGDADDDIADEGDARDQGRGRRSDGRDGRSDRADFDDDAPRGDLQARVEKLEDEVKSLRRQLAIVGRGRVAIDGAAGDSEDLETVTDSPELDSAVRDIVADERQRERDERFRRFSERALERLTEDAGLSTTQSDAIAALWDTEREKLMPLIVAAREGDRDFDEVRDEAEAIRIETDTEARKVLSEAQLAAYEEHRPRGPGGRRGRDDDGGRGGRGDGR